MKELLETDYSLVYQDLNKFNKDLMLWDQLPSNKIRDKTKQAIYDITGQI